MSQSRSTLVTAVNMHKTQSLLLLGNLRPSLTEAGFRVKVSNQQSWPLGDHSKLIEDPRRGDLYHQLSYGQP